MSKAVGNGDLQLMAEYDFKTPIDATVIIYDSDDDDNTKLPIEKEPNSNKKIDNNGNELFENLNKLSNKSNQETEVTSTKRRNSSGPTNDKKRKTSNTTELMFPDKIKVSSRDSANNISYNLANSREDQHLNSNQIPTTVFQGSKERHPLASMVQAAQNLDDIKKKTNECLQTLFDTVSTHMVFVMKAYAEYLFVTKSTSDRTVSELAHSHYRDTKSHFFYLSFSAVANIMLPRENDSAFIEKFIDDTVKLAEAKHLLFKHSDMKSLCMEMFCWVKSYIQHPLLAGLLGKHPRPTQLTTNITSNTNTCQAQDCDKSHNALDNTTTQRGIFSSGPIGREVTISVASTVFQNSQNNTQQCHDLVHNVPRQITQPREEMRNNANSTNYSFMQQFQDFNARNNINRQNSANQPKSKKRGSKSVQQQIDHHSTSTPQKMSRPSAPPPCNLKQAWHHETQSYDTPRNYSENQLTNQVPYDIFQAEQGQMEVNRSLSRDSGFISPLSSIPCDPMSSSPRYERIDSSATSITPLITHVTSLNPSVAFIKNGICHVCGKLTRQMCLGCYKYYYCSIDCQNHDWKYHVLICK